MRNIWRIGLAAAATLALAIPASAQLITITPGNNPQPDEQNILLNNGTTGTTVFGLTNQTNTQVQFTSTQLLTEPSNGQARVEAADATGAQIPLTTVTFSIPGGTFGDLIFNTNVSGTVGAGGNITIDAVADPGSGASNATLTTTYGNGSNFFTVLASGGAQISSVTITATGYTDLRQVRVSGVLIGGVPPSSVPEPGTWAMMAGMGLPALGLIRRRRKA